MARGGDMITRRDFLKLTGGSTVAWYVATQSGWIQRAAATVPGGTLDPGSVSKFVTPLLVPPVMPRAGTIAATFSRRVATVSVLRPSGLSAGTFVGLGRRRMTSSPTATPNSSAGGAST